MAYVQQVRRRAADKMADEGMVVKRDPQRASASQVASSPRSSAPVQSTPPQSTFFSVVFVTASPTFTGDVAGYTTLTGEPRQTQQRQQTQETQQTEEPQETFTQPESTQQETTQQAPETTEAPTTIQSSVEVSVTDLGSLTVASSTAISSYVPYSRSATRSYTNVAPTGDSDASEGEAPKGMSAGGKAGLAIGILLIIGLLAGGILFFFWKKKKENKHQALDDEKVGGYSGPIAAAARAQGTKSEKSDSNAPRLSLRPVTQFTASLANAGKRLSQNPHNKPNQPTGMAAAGTGRNLTAGPGQNPFQDPPANPFGDQNKANLPTPNVTITPPASDTDGSVAGGAIAGAAMAGAKDQPRAGPGGPQPNVHRVQLDFKPSMDDELGLKAGQLIRVMHEYDDGWALCVRLDGSQQGVAPRTCLSARPVKPRPGNGSPRMGPNGRPMSPAQSRPMTPNGGRPMSPAGGPGPRANSPALSRPGTSQSNRAMSPPNNSQQPMPQGNQPGQFNQAPRPLSPGPVPRSPVTAAPKRSQSPGPYGAESGPAPMSTEQRRRSNSAGAPLRGNRNSPPSSSPLAQGDRTAGWRPPRPGQGY